jgi:hypothetical protein
VASGAVSHPFLLHQTKAGPGPQLWPPALSGARERVSERVSEAALLLLHSVSPACPSASRARAKSFQEREKLINSLSAGPVGACLQEALLENEGSLNLQLRMRALVSFPAQAAKPAILRLDARGHRCP